MRWGFKFVTPPNQTNYFCYGYWGWPKEFVDVREWLNKDATKYYSTPEAGANQKFYGPVSSAPGSWTEMDMKTTSGISSDGRVIVHFFRL